MQVTGLRSHSDKCQVEPKKEVSSLYSLTHSFIPQSFQLFYQTYFVQEAPRVLGVQHGEDRRGPAPRSQRFRRQTKQDTNGMDRPLLIRTGALQKANRIEG